MKKLSILTIFFAITITTSCDKTDSQLFDLILDIKSQNDQLLNEVKTLQIKSDLLIAELRLSAAKQEELLARVSDLQTQLSNILSQIDSLNKQIHSQGADIELIKNKLSELQTQYQSVVEQLQELQKLSLILAEIEKMKTQLADLNTKYDIISNGFSDNKQQLDDIKAQVTSIQNQLTDNFTKIAQLTSQLGDQSVVIGNILKQMELLRLGNAELINLFDILILDKSPVPTNGLVGWWPFNGNANDESGNNLNGTVSNAVLTSDRTGKLNSAYSFNSNQLITIQNSQNLNPYPMTISLWYNISSIISNVPLLKKYAPATWNGYMIGICDCNNVSDGSQINNNIYGTFPWYLRGVRLGIFGNYDQAPFLQPNIIAQRWYHYVLTIDQMGGKIYLDGKLIASDQWTGQAGPVFNNLLLQIGGYYDLDNWFKGKIDDVAIWNRALTAEEISKIYSGQGF